MLKKVKSELKKSKRINKAVNLWAKGLKIIQVMG